jgi:excisionase family DNA binding protein
MAEVKASIESEFMRIKQAADYLGCSQWLLWKKMGDGHLKRYKFDGGGLTYVRRSELDALMSEAQ